MTKRKQPPTVRMRRLAGELLQLRKQAGLSREEVAEQTNINAATIYRLETAKVRPQVRTLTTLLDLYLVERERQEDYVALLRDSGQRGWLQTFEEALPEQYATYIAFEAEADAVWNFETSFVPGQMQTEAYAYRVIAGTLPEATDEEIRSKVEARLRRQEALSRPKPLKLWAIIDEAVLRRPIGTPEEYKEQLKHLMEVAQRSNVTLQVTPFDAGPHPGMLGSFATLKFSEQGTPDVVYIESGAGDLFLEDEGNIARYNLVFEHLRAVALSPAASLRMIGQLAESDG